MMDKPTLKREVAVKYVLRSVNEIGFHATDDAVTEFMKLGKLYEAVGASGGYQLYVDSRYDFDEVLAFIENYG